MTVEDIILIYELAIEQEEQIKKEMNNVKEGKRY